MRRVYLPQSFYTTGGAWSGSAGIEMDAEPEESLLYQSEVEFRFI
jgi:hypothetical protein